MLVVVAVTVARNRHHIVDSLRQMSPAAVAGSFALSALAGLAGMRVWRSLLADLGAPLAVGDAARIFFLSQLGKYVPGSLWSIATQMELGRDHDVPRRTSLTVGILTIAVSLGVGLPVAAVMLPLSSPAAARRYWEVVLVVPVLLVGLHPAILGRVLRIASRLLRRPAPTDLPSWPGLLRAAGWQSLVWLLLGLHVWVLAVSVGAPAGRSLPAAVGGLALAYSLGLLAVPVPAGAGIRDLALALALSAVLPASAALVVALVSRTLLLLTDLALAGVMLLPGLRRAAGRR